MVYQRFVATSVHVCRPWCARISEWVSKHCYTYSSAITQRIGGGWDWSRVLCRPDSCRFDGPRKSARKDALQETWFISAAIISKTWYIFTMQNTQLTTSETTRQHPQTRIAKEMGKKKTCIVSLSCLMDDCINPICDKLFLTWTRPRTILWRIKKKTNVPPTPH